MILLLNFFPFLSCMFPTGVLSFSVWFRWSHMKLKTACWVWHLCLTLCTPRTRLQTVTLSPSWSLPEQQQEHTETAGSPGWRNPLEENLRRLWAFWGLARTGSNDYSGLSYFNISSLNGTTLYFKRWDQALGHSVLMKQSFHFKHFPCLWFSLSE